MPVTARKVFTKSEGGTLNYGGKQCCSLQFLYSGRPILFYGRFPIDHQAAFLAAELRSTLHHVNCLAVDSAFMPDAPVRAISRDKRRCGRPNPVSIHGMQPKRLDAAVSHRLFPLGAVVSDERSHRIFYDDVARLP